MNSMRSLEALLLREHETRIVSMRGKELPKHDRGDADAETRLESEAIREKRATNVIALVKLRPYATAGQIAREVGASRPTVQAILKAHGLRTKSSANQWTIHEDELKARQKRCTELRAEGLEHQQIADRLGLTERQVRYALRPS